MNKNKTVLIVEDEKDLLDSWELVETAGLMALQHPMDIKH